MAASQRGADDARPAVRYDDDGTMYTLAAWGMRGQRASTLRGTVTMRSGTGWRGRWADFVLVTKSPRKDALRPAYEARMLRHGYRPDDELDKRLLFRVRSGAWHDADGRPVAVQRRDALHVVDGVEGPLRDLVVACWVMRLHQGEWARLAT